MARVRQHRIAETVASELRARILAGDGDYRLPTQDQLVSEFGVSYPSVREAIRILETEGLVTVRRGKVGGAEVHRPGESSAAYHLGLALQARRVTLGDLASGLQMLEPQSSAGSPKELVPLLQELAVGTMLDATRHRDRLPIESLQAVEQHRAVDLLQQPTLHFDHMIGPNAHQTGVEGSMMEFAQRQAVRHNGLSSRVAVRQDVRRIQELRMVVQTADRAANAVGE